MMLSIDKLVNAFINSGEFNIDGGLEMELKCAIAIKYELSNRISSFDVLSGEDTGYNIRRLGLMNERLTEIKSTIIALTGLLTSYSDNISESKSRTPN